MKPKNAAVKKTIKHLKEDNKECKEENKEHNKLIKGLKKKK